MKASPSAQSAVAMRRSCPPGRRAAVLLRGEAFRAGHGTTPCRSEHVPLQRQAWHSLLKHVVEPLEDCGAAVDVAVTECSAADGCKLVEGELERVFSGRLIAKRTRCRTRDQAASMRATLNLFKGVAKPSSYDLILVTRHDLVWTVPLTAWHSDWRLFNFFSWCERRCTSPAEMFQSNRSCGFPSMGGTPVQCVNDIAHAMPGALFASFDEVVSAPGLHCFELNLHWFPDGDKIQ